MRRVNAGTIGYWAHRSLQEFKTGMVIGETSRGTFLLLGGERVVFISNEAVLSPLTITLQSGRCDWQRVTLRSSVEVEDGIIRIDKAYELSIQRAQIWEPAFIASAAPPVEGVRERLAEVARELIEMKGNVGWAGYLAFLVGSKTLPPPAEFASIEKQVNLLQIAMFSERVEQVRTALKPFYGLGRGLTPSGDDFVIGLLLVLSRWPGSVNFHPNLGELMAGVITDAQLLTTRISQAMITCATQGYADERLMGALDGIISGRLPVGECADRLASYGGSSGVDALVGAAVLFLL